MNLVCLDKNFSTTKLLYKLIVDKCLDKNGKIKEECKWSINNSKFNIRNSKLIGSPEDKFETMLFLPEGEGRKGEGGLRTKGYFKFSYENLIMNDECLIMNDKYGNRFKYNPSNSTFNIQNSKLNTLPLISIITVVYNGEKYLEETIQSVINQTYPNVEYIIIDGGSTDGTLDIIKKYEDKIDYWVSEKDKGIYDAMNKGIDLASGEWINFMNAGDLFFMQNVLSDIFFKSDLNDFEILYGDTCFKYPEFYKNQKAPSILNILWKGMCFAHQSTFINAKYHKKNKFIKNMKIGADFAFFYDSYIKKARFKYIAKTISTMEIGGISYTDRVSSIKDHYAIVSSYDNSLKVRVYYEYLIVLNRIKPIIKKILPKFLVDFLQKIK